MTKQIRNTHKRVLRFRELNANQTITSIFGLWDRTVCFSEIRKYFQCPGMYLMDKEGDARYRRALSQEIGDLLHEETAKPMEERLQDTVAIAARLKNVDPEQRMQVAIAVKEMIAKAVQIDDIESMDAELTEHEVLMTFYDKYTDTTWFAKPDKRELVTEADGRKYMSIVDQKTGKHRKSMDKVGVFFFGYVARMTEALDFRGPIQTMVRYLRDWDGNLLDRPDEKIDWIGRRLSRKQEDTLQGIQETVRKMDSDWKSGEFELRAGNHCKGCQHRHTCPLNADKWAEHLAWEAEQSSIRTANADLVRVKTLASATPIDDGSAALTFYPAMLSSVSQPVHVGA